MKKAVRFSVEQSWQPDKQAFGFTWDEYKRAERFRKQNPEVCLITPLIERGISKSIALLLWQQETCIAVPVMYRLGFSNNNCVGCVKAQSPSYWNLVRRLFPSTFEERARLSRELGCRLVKGSSGQRLFLDELSPTAIGDEPFIDCGLLCSADVENYENVGIGTKKGFFF